VVNADECDDVKQSRRAEGVLGFTVQLVIDAMAG